MKKLMVLACMAATVSLATGSAMADSIKGRAGATLRIGFTAPNDSDFENLRIKPDIGIIGGGGLIYGVNDTTAVEFDITHSSYGSDYPNGGNAGDFDVTNFSLGGQYRFTPANKLVPYIGAGLDILVSDYKSHDVDTTVGVHVSGGVDYFLMKSLAVTAEVKAVIAPETDIKSSAGHGNFDPSSLNTTFGVRYFFF
ncbi:outer membrane beta-barrel protein [Pelotalea chapellei]|uniref:Outer membrane beta-barrel protein n=1 Tax=Pelotalea chapellei TaxID=44671 RepID=A0ABS5UB32_9BACT|nr:outer membrane beta-barrel protein [Pelotalea chapellei]MBT1072892.1 outer membrane beta-barrel protein [Pelotalea chapellei]